MLYGYTTLVMHCPIVDVGVFEVLDTKKWAFYVSFIFEKFAEVIIHCYYFSCIVISMTKEGVKFSSKGDIGSANIVCRQNSSFDKVITF